MEHIGYDHRGVLRRCVQEIHFCIDDYGAPTQPTSYDERVTICELGHLERAALADDDDVALCAHYFGARSGYCRRLAWSITGAGASLYARLTSAA